ncbi:MAG: TPM domain-containing protein [bacterium]|nr:TPM domain-containing protein [bacterium]
MPGRSDIPRKFFSAAEQGLLREAIAAAEMRTSGEIRLHLERDVPAKAPVYGDSFVRAREIFAELRMHETAERNGVLVYLATRSRKFAVLGDEELHRRVGVEFWNDVRDLMTERFRVGQFAEGVCEGIALVGEKLRAHFPYRKDDVNELPDEISY